MKNIILGLFYQLIHLMQRLKEYTLPVSLLPIIAMAAFSYLFMNRALDRWFSQLPQSVIQQARNLEQPSINSSLAELEKLSHRAEFSDHVG